MTKNNISTLQALDQQNINRFHWRMIITAGTGFFTDAYDLFIIGIVTALLTPLWHLYANQLAILNGASLASAALGAVAFGWLADKLGRKKMYGIEVLILFLGAIASACAPSFYWLLIARIIMGFGIGGDYPTSAVVATECANRKNRGFIVLMVFAMQALGLIVGPLLASALMITSLSHDIIWRLLLGFGAIPAASVFYLRRQLKETPRFLLSQQAPLEVSRAVSAITGYKEQITPTHSFKKHKLFSAPWIKYLIGTASAWFLLDIAFYGNGVSSALILKNVNPAGNLLTSTLISMLIFISCAVPGYYCAAKYVDKIGRKPLQILGFLMMAVCYFAIACLKQPHQSLILFCCLFGLSFFFVNFGPNTTTFLIPSEIFPTNIRATAHGLSAAIGKLGAFVGAFLLPLILNRYGLSVTMMLLALIASLGIFTSLLVPEMKNIALEANESLATL